MRQHPLCLYNISSILCGVRQAQALQTSKASVLKLSRFLFYYFFMMIVNVSEFTLFMGD